MQQKNEPSAKPLRPLRILSLDGGGIRGLIEVQILSILSQNFFNDSSGKKLLDYFDLVCGTSTGGILATALAEDLPLEDCHNLYMDIGAKLFRHPYFFGGGVKAFHYLWNGEEYDSDLLTKMIIQYLGSKPLSEVNPHKKTFVVSTNATKEAWKPYLFRSYHKPKEDKKSLEDSSKEKHSINGAPILPGTSKATVPEALRATSAAPTFFKPFLYNCKDGTVKTFVDGGLTANNPTELAIFEARALWPDREIDCIVSLGCGKPKPGQGSTNLLGLVDGLVDICSSAELIHKNVKSWVHMTLPQTKYFRFSPRDGEGSIPLDESDPRVLNKMVETTTDYMATKSNKIQRLKRALLGKHEDSSQTAKLATSVLSLDDFHVI
jgi:predicted acylesterase/phospholipase RssA